ncbi:cartilage intermediate layer protein 2-like isoform X2 [Sander lucioperca]|uniref:cartilage intermediate layer protein 2-like isoform X2 n=1 Tax=Sander lucioperca TaxID=283035 RepID=UPI001653D834|nr:cartilage intermediate layer protein 2-like isoform X2 [Sander lucioperca]
MIQLLSVAIVAGLFFGCWTKWFDRDDPSGTGDWETLSDLRKEYPGKICSKPVGVEARTLSGLTVAAAGDVIYVSDTTTGFVCRNQDQPRNKMCNDYRVRFSCPPAFCKECWTDWFDRDDPSGTGDWETLSDLRKEYPGKICSKPVGVETRTLSGLTVAAAGDVIYVSDTTTGFVCRNQDQPRNKMCNDYRVRFSCPPCFCKVCWTKWYNRDAPSGTGDWENLINLRTENPGQICDHPLSIEAVTTDTLTPAISTGQTFISNPTDGFVCRNTDQKSGACRDYKVRFGCPCN